MRLFAAILVLSAGASVTLGQTAWEIADRYAAMALTDNPDLRAKRTDRELADLRTRDAFGKMLPTVDLSSRYTRAKGGREIRFDINDFIPSSMIPQDLPATVIPFLREREQETKVTVIQPLFAGGGIYHNWRSKQQLGEAENAAYQASASMMVFEVRKVYFGLLASRELARMRGSEVKLAAEQLRVAEARINAQTAPDSERKRALASLAETETKKIEADTNVELALVRLNLLLGRPLDTEPDTPAIDVSVDTLDTDLDEAIIKARNERWEIRQLDRTAKALDEALKAARSSYMPSVSAALEYGFQGEKYEFTGDADYYLLSGVLSWNLFKGLRSDVQRQEVQVTLRKLDAQRAWVAKQIQQDVTASYLTLKSKHAQHEAAQRGKEAAEEGFRMIERMYAEGMASQVELLDARTALIGALGQEIASRYEILIALADIERSMGRILEDGDQ